MTLNDVLTKQNVITKLELKDGDKELPKALKVKIMRMRMAYNKIKKAFDDDVKEFVEQLTTEDYKVLANKPDRTEEEEKQFKEYTDKINAEYLEFINQKGFEEIKEDLKDTFTEDEYADLLDVNSGGEVEVNGNKIKAADFMEAVYEIFVKDNNEEKVD